MSYYEVIQFELLQHNKINFVKNWFCLNIFIFTFFSQLLNNQMLEIDLKYQ